MRAYNIEKHKETLYTIQEKLLSFMKTDDYLKKGKDNEKDAKIGDVSFMVSININNINYNCLISYISYIYIRYSIFYRQFLYILIMKLS